MGERSEATRSGKLWRRGARQELARKAMSINKEDNEVDDESMMMMDDKGSWRN